MSVLRKAAQRVRHLPGLEACETFWNILRKPYHRLLDANGRGVKVFIGGKVPVRIPAEFVGARWELYEPETIAVFAEWVCAHPNGLVLDIGSSIGVFSAVALFTDHRAEVIAFDADLASLAAARRFCEHASGERLRLVRGLLTHNPPNVVPLAEAIALTDRALVQSGGEVGTPRRYICLTDPEAVSLPSYRLDDLFAMEKVEDRSVLIKCDVEGAELLVLSGAENLLRHARPDLLLSIHPAALPSYGHSKEGVDDFLKGLGYQNRCFSVDHEEHWWCEVKKESAI